MKNEKALIIHLANRHKENPSGNADSALSCRPMSDDALLRAIETAPPGSQKVIEYTAAFFVFSVAGDVLQTGEYDPKTHAAADRQVRRLRHPHLPARNALRDGLAVADGSKRAPGDWRSALVEYMTAYAHVLRTEGKFALAAERFAKAAEVDKVHHSATLAALQGRAWVLRHLGEHAQAEEAYRRMRTLAARNRDALAEMDADLGLSTIMVEAGNLPGSETLTQEVLARAERDGASQIVARARGHLAAIAGIRERYDEAIEHAHAALRGPLSFLDRDICLANIAFAFRQIRWLKTAERYARRTLAVAVGAEQRAAALITLYHLALDRGLDSSPYREALDGGHMSVATRADLYEVVARGHWLSGNIPLACRELEAGLAFANENRLNRAAFQFDEALQAMGRGAAPGLFRQPARKRSAGNTSALRGIEAEARKADAKSSLGIRVWFAPSTDNDETRAATAVSV